MQCFSTAFSDSISCVVVLQCRVVVQFLLLVFEFRRVVLVFSVQIFLSCYIDSKTMILRYPLSIIGVSIQSIQASFSDNRFVSYCIDCIWGYNVEFSRSSSSYAKFNIEFYVDCIVVQKMNLPIQNWCQVSKLLQHFLFYLQQSIISRACIHLLTFTLHNNFFLFGNFVFCCDNCLKYFLRVHSVTKEQKHYEHAYSNYNNAIRVIFNTFSFVLIILILFIFLFFVF